MLGLQKSFTRHLIWVPLFLLFACHPKEPDKVKPLTLIAANTMLFYPWVQNDVVILPVRAQDQDQVIALDLYMGDTLWSTFIENPEDVYYNFTAAIKGNYLYAPMGNKLYKWCFCEEEPRMIQIPVNGVLQAHLTSSGNDIYTVLQDLELSTNWILSLNTVEETWDTLLQLPYEKGRKLTLRPPVAYADDKGQLQFSSPIIDYASRDTAYSYLLHWRKDSEIDSIEAYAPNKLGVGASRQALLWRNHAIYWVHDQIVALDMTEGKVIWILPMSATMLTSKPLLINEKDLLMCALEDQRLYAIDLATQSIAWQSDLAGTPSRCFRKDSVVAVVGGSDGRYYEFNVNDGNMELQSPKELVCNRPLYVDERVTIMLSKGKWWIDANLQAIAERIKTSD